MWPARDYTRLTLESTEALEYSIFTLKDPERLVLDIETDELSPALNELNDKVAAEDPYIQGLRIARNRPGVVRLVLDLKAEVRPIVFSLRPIADYGHRLVLDLHPLVAVDPLALLIEEAQKRPPRTTKPGVVRLATIVIDPGHGGEDPGAIGRRGSREKDINLSMARRLKALVDADSSMRARSRPTSWCRSTPMLSSGRTYAALPCSRSPTGAPPPRWRASSPSRKTTPT